MSRKMMVFGDRWFKRYQTWLLLFANTLIGRLVLGIPLNVARIRKLTPDSCASSRDGVHYQARVFAGKQYANRLYYALKPLWWFLHAIDNLNARNGLRLNFGFDTLNIYSPASGVSVVGNAYRTAAQDTLANLRAGAGTGSETAAASIDLICGATTTNFTELRRMLVTFRTDGVIPTNGKPAAVSISAASVNLWATSAHMAAGTSPAISLVGSTPASKTALASADYGQVQTTQYASDLAYASVSFGAYNAMALNGAGLTYLILTNTHTCFGVTLSWDRANSFGGTWGSTLYWQYDFGIDVNHYPYIALTYTLQSAPVVSSSVVGAAAAGYVAGQFTLLTAAVLQVRLLVADNAAFTAPAVDTGWVAMPLAINANARVLGTWIPAAAGHYYGKIGVDSNYYTLYGDVISFDVAFPTITSVTKGQSRDTFTWTIVIADTYKQPPLVSIIVDDCAYPAKLTTFSPGSYTYIATASLERGKHQWKTVASNLWQTLTTDYAPLYAEYALTTPGISIFAGGAKLQAWGASISDALLPEYPVLSFTSNTWLPGDQTVTALCFLRGIKRYEFLRRYASKNADGTWTYQCESVDKRRLEDVTSVMVDAVEVNNVLAQVISPIRLADNYGVLMPGFIYQTKWELAVKAGIVSQLLVQAGVNAWCRSGTMYCHAQDVSAQTPRFAVQMNDVMASFNEDAQTFDWVRVWYAIQQYPVVATSLTNYDSANWTGTVTSALKTGDGILPASGSLYCLAGTGSIVRASLLAKFSDFDRFRMRWSPPSGTTTLDITLQTDAGNKYTYTRTFAGSTGAGFNQTGGSAPDGIVTKSISLGSRRIVSVTGQMTAPCAVTMKIKLGATTIWTGDKTATSGENNTWTVSVPESIYTAGPVDTLELAFTQLYYVANAYGVSCTKLDVNEYAQISQVTGSHSYVTSYRSCRFALGVSYVSILGTGYIRFNRAFLCAKPALAAGETLNISYENCNMTLWMVGQGATPVQRVAGGGFTVVEDGGNLYVTAADIVRGTNLGDIIDVVDASGTIIVTTSNTIFSYVVVWVTQAFAWLATYNLWDEIDLPLSVFTKTGSPTNLVSIILNATGVNYYDGLYLYANQPTNRYVDAKTGAGTHKMPDRTGDGFGSANAAQAFANGLLALVSTPAKDYAIEKPLDTDIELGDPVSCDGEVLAVYGIAYDFERGHMIVKVGKRVQETLEVLKDHAERIDRLENVR